MTSYKKADQPPVSPEQMYELGGRLFERTLEDPAVSRKLQASKLIVRFRYHDRERWGDNEAQITIDLTRDPVEITTGPSELKPNLEMTMDVMTAHLFWMEKLHLMSALTRGQIKAKGPIPRAMRLLPALKPFHKNYRILLKEMGRDDLLNFPPEQ